MLAPIYVLRVWAYCQQRKTWQFPDLGADALRGICKAPHDPELLLDSMAKAGYIERMGNGFSSSAWAALNAQLIAAWTNGKNGGRPSKKPSGIPTVTQGANPTVNQGVNPTATVGQTDKRREEKKHPSSAPAGAPPSPSPAAPPAPPAPPAAPPPPGVDLFGGAPPRAPRQKPAPAQSVDAFIDSKPEGVSAQVWAEWLAYRLEYASKNRKEPFTAAAVRGVGAYLKRCNATGESSDDALVRSMAQGWKVPYPDSGLLRQQERAQGIGHGMRRPTAHDQASAAGAALAGFGRPQPVTERPHGTDRPDTSEAEDIDYREHPGAPE